MSDLVKRNQGGGLPSRVEVSVLTKADPIPGLLRVARAIIQRTPSLRATFEAARKDGWTSDFLTAQLQVELGPYFGEPVPEDPANIEAVARYLADEYMQLGDAILLVSSETGRAIARLRDEDFYQPAPVPREGGGLATPGLRVRPEIEAAVVQWQFDRAHEDRAQSAMLAKLPQTALLRAQGDRRALFATRQGRKVLTAEIGAHLPSLLPDQCKGATKTLFNYLRIVNEAPADPAYTCLGEVTNHATATYPLSDKKAKNLRHDVWSSILATTASGWARSVAHFVLGFAKDQKAEDVTISALQLRRGVNFWVCSPNVVVALNLIHPEWSAEFLPVGTGDDFALGFSEPCGFVVIDESSYDIKDREVFDRWEVATSFRAKVWVDWSRVAGFVIHNVPPTGLAVEVV